MFYSILKSLNIKESKHMELRAITADYIETINYEEEKAIFQEENCNTKSEYAKKLRKNGYYANYIALEAISKKQKQSLEYIKVM